jgi:hypothetical protein
MKLPFNYLSWMADGLRVKSARSYTAASQQLLRRFAWLLASSKSQLGPQKGQLAAEL